MTRFQGVGRKAVLKMKCVLKIKTTHFFFFFCSSRKQKEKKKSRYNQKYKNL